MFPWGEGLGRVEVYSDRCITVIITIIIIIIIMIIITTVIVITIITTDDDIWTLKQKSSIKT